MDVGVALPQMARDYGPSTTVAWARGIDEGPFSSVSAGERVTFSNPELAVTLGAAAAVTSRVRVFANLWVLPAHPTAMIAQQIGTLDQLSDGRLTVGLGVGGREHDYEALGASFAGRHARLERQAVELRQLLDGKPPFVGADPVGPSVVQPGGPPLLAGALGPKSMARAARWADGVTGFSVGGRRRELDNTNQLADRAWAEAGRATPYKVNGCFYALGVDEPLSVLRTFTERYLAWTGPEFATAMAADTWVASPDDVRRVLDDAEAAGCDEFILVPATADLRCLDATRSAVASL